MTNSTLLGKKTLLIKAPGEVTGALTKFDSFFSDLHKFVEGQKGLDSNDKTISFELVLKENYLHYRIVLSAKILQVVSSLIYAQFQDAEIIEEELIDPSDAQKNIIELVLKRSNLFPLKTEFSSEDDPYVAMSAVLSKLEHFNEGIVLQIVLVPASESWLKKFVRENFYAVVGTVNKIKLFFENPFLERAYVDYYAECQKKFNKKIFWTNVRVLAYAQDEPSLKEDFTLMLQALEKFNNGDVNSLRKRDLAESKLLDNFFNRRFSPTRVLLNTLELAAFFHFPDSGLKLENVHHVSSKKVEPPQELPMGKFLQTPEVSIFGVTRSRGNKLEFGIKRVDRPRHLYIIGKTGMGKSKLIELLAISDIHENKGVAIIDPHGDLASNILRFIPRERLQDVVYFNIPDSEYPIGFNPLECFTPEAKHQVVTGFVGIFKKLFAFNWTNRLEHVLRFTVLALIEAGDATVVDIVKLLTDATFRQQTIRRLHDPVVKNFWTHEFSSWNEKFDNEAIIPIINQVGQFISNEYIRNVVGQKRSQINFYSAMNEGKILIVNLAKGKLGEENAALLGSMMISKIQEAAMARVSIPESERREFYLYVDEFQNFATEAFNQILSEARKFNISLTIAHQYIDQLLESVRKTAFGNVGSIICFRVGSDDAHYLQHEFAPSFTSEDIVNLDFREIYVKLSINGKTSEPFSAQTIDVPSQTYNLEEEIIQFTRENYATPKKQVESELFKDETTAMIIESTEEKKKDHQDNGFEEPII